MPARSGLGSEEASNEARTGVPEGNDPVEVRYLRRDGAPVWVQATRALVTGDAGDLRYVLTMVVDADARRRAAAEQRAMEERLREMQKLESLGVLAGGIAHDFNNLLVPILGNAELALQELPPGSPLRDGLREIVRAAERAADLARQMLAYSGRGRFVIEPTDLSVLVRGMADLLRASIARGLSLELALAPDLPHVEADASQLRQLVLNLVLNASEAIGPAGGAIVVRTGLLRVTRAFLESAHFAADLAEGDHVFLSVSDTGPGMGADLRGRIFDPFFTTKSLGRGLGLPTVLGIVRGHHGAIHVESEAGRGTTVTVVLPPARATQEACGVKAGEESPPARRATVLVVEDDVAVRMLTERTLERAGYRVLAAADGAEAVEVVRQRGGEIGCVLLDMMTPRLRGPDVCRAIKALAPGAAVVAMSGFLGRDLTGDLGAMVSGMLHKPFTPSMLREAVEAALSK
jgi:signal transduction histidine kinase